MGLRTEIALEPAISSILTVLPFSLSVKSFSSMINDLLPVMTLYIYSTSRMSPCYAHDIGVSGN